MRRRWIVALLVAGSALVVSGLSFWWNDSEPPAEIPSAAVRASQEYAVIEVIDGDTLRVDIQGKARRVRLIGLNAPELQRIGKSAEPPQYYAKEAASFLTNLLQGEKVWLEQEPMTNKADRYDRLLMYVYRYPDGMFVNHELVRQGYAKHLPRYPFRHSSMFYQSERSATKAGRGLWAKK